MSRIIITKKMVSSFPPGLFTIKEDPWYSTIVKLIPGEIISVYFALFNMVRINKEQPAKNDLLQLIIFGIFLIICPLYLRKIAKIKSIKQIIYCSIAFIIWVLSFGGPVEGLQTGGYSVQFLGSLILPLYTLVAPLVYHKTEKSAAILSN